MTVSIAASPDTAVPVRAGQVEVYQTTRTDLTFLGVISLRPHRVVECEEACGNE